MGLVKHEPAWNLSTERTPLGPEGREKLAGGDSRRNHEANNIRPRGAVDPIRSPRLLALA